MLRDVTKKTSEMMRLIALAAVVLQLLDLTLVNCQKQGRQQLQLSESYLPVAMQVIAHLTDQMAYEIRDEPTQATKPVKTTPKPTVTPTKRPMWTTSKTTAKPPTKQPMKPTSRPPLETTTVHHKPGLYQPFAPPKPSERTDTKTQQQFVLLPMESNSEYTVIEPEDKKTGEPLLSIHEEEVKPLVEPSPEDAPLLLPHFDSDKIQSRSDALDIIDDDSLQYLSQNVREMIKLATDPNDDKLVDVWEEVRAGPQQMAQKVKLSTSNLRLLLLYDLLSREAKRQRLNDYTGFAPDVMRTLVESSSGGARAQLRLALSKMLDRHDCEHEYANNRAREMVTELAKDESKLSSELRYLQPLVYVY